MPSLVLITQCVTVCVSDGLLGGDHCTHRDDIPIPQFIQNLLVKRPDLKNQNTSVTD